MVGRINKSNSRARHWRQCANDDARDFSDPIDLADTRFARNVVALWKLGPRPVFELLSEIGGRVFNPSFCRKESGPLCRQTHARFVACGECRSNADASDPQRIRPHYGTAKGM